MSTCLFAGTFDPITVGHTKMIEKLLNKYDKVVVAIGVNPLKTPLFSLEDRLSFIKKAFENSSRVEVDSYTSLTVEYMQKKGIKILVRGIRNQEDMLFERENEEKSKNIYPELITEYVLAEEKDKSVSSTEVRKAIENGKEYKNLVPKESYLLIEQVVKKLKENKG